MRKFKRKLTLCGVYFSQYEMNKNDGKDDFNVCWTITLHVDNNTFSNNVQPTSQPTRGKSME